MCLIGAYLMITEETKTGIVMSGVRVLFIVIGSRKRKKKK